MVRLDRLQGTPVFLLFELDAQAWTREALTRLQRPLPRPGAEELGMLAAHDLGRIVPAVRQCGLCMLGASFDPSELLRPGLPILAALTAQYRLSLSGEGFQQRLLFLGAVDGRLPDPALAPATEVPASPWRIMPLQLIGEDSALPTVSEALESRLLEQGECAPPVQTALAGWFGASIAHARYLTLLDLLALLRAQYQQAELAALSELLEAALLDPQAALTSDSGLALAWDGQRARLAWHWLQPDAASAQRQAQRAQVAEQRRLLQGLALHRIPVAWPQQAALSADELLSAETLCGELASSGSIDDQVARLRLHEDSELGLLLAEGLDRNGQLRCRLQPLGPSAMLALNRLLPDCEREVVAWT